MRINLTFPSASSTGVPSLAMIGRCLSACNASTKQFTASAIDPPATSATFCAELLIARENCNSYACCASATTLRISLAGTE